LIFLILIKYHDKDKYNKFFIFNSVTFFDKSANMLETLQVIYTLNCEQRSKLCHLRKIMM